MCNRISRLIAMTIVVASAITSAGSPSHAQGTPSPLVTLTRLDGPIVLDGVPNEAAWQSIPTLPLTMYTPVFRGTPTQRTEIRVAYDDEAFYAACWCYDSEPSRIRINSLYRDR
ncbi:MAG: hypothetical protein AB1762_15630, partial [Gemmatimonadota bacterium]